MAALTDGGDSPQKAPRRKRQGRYTPNPTPLKALTPKKLELLSYLAECRLLTLSQLAVLAQLSRKGVERQMRTLFDAELVEVIPIARIALASDELPNTGQLLYGSAPNLYVPTKAALRILVESGLLESRYLKRSIPLYGPRQTPFLRHELLVRDVRVWLERLRHAGYAAPIRWEDGVEAHLDLQPQGVVRPDAWFVLEIPPQNTQKYSREDEKRSQVLIGLVEVDRGTERGRSRWSEKVDAYAALFLSGRLTELTGYRRARVLVICKNEARRDTLAGLIAELAGTIELPQSGGSLASRFWLTTVTTLESAQLGATTWRRISSPELVPLVED